MSRSLVPVLLGILLAVLLGAGCSALEESNVGRAAADEACEPGAEWAGETVVVVLFDASGSTGGKRIRDRYMSGFSRVLRHLGSGEGALLAVAPVNADSIDAFDPLQCSFPELGGNTNRLTFRRTVGTIETAAKRRADEIVRGQRAREGTAILDALTAAGGLLSHFPEAKNRSVVVFSDMVEESKRLRMTRKVLTRGGTASFVAAEQQSSFFPELDGVSVYVAGAGVTSTPGAGRLDRAAMMRFWLRYLGKTGARVAHYGPSLPVFP